MQFKTKNMKMRRNQFELIIHNCEVIVDYGKVSKNLGGMIKASWSKKYKYMPRNKIIQIVLHI